MLLEHSRHQRFNLFLVSVFTFFTRSLVFLTFLYTFQCTASKPASVPVYGGFPSDWYFRYDPLSHTLRKHAAGRPDQNKAVSAIWPVHHIDGISPSAGLMVPVSCDLRPDLVPARIADDKNTVLLYNLSRYKTEEAWLSYDRTGCRLILRPVQPLMPDAIYAVLVNRRLNENPSYSNVNPDYRKFVSKAFYGQIDTEAAESVRFALRAVQKQFGLRYHDLQALQVFPVRSAGGLTGPFYQIRNALKEAGKGSFQYKKTGNCSAIFTHSWQPDCTASDICSYPDQYGPLKLSGSVNFRSGPVMIVFPGSAAFAGKSDTGQVLIENFMNDNEDADLKALRIVQLSLVLSELGSLRPAIGCMHRYIPEFAGYCNEPDLCPAFLALTGEVARVAVYAEGVSRETGQSKVTQQVYRTSRPSLQTAKQSVSTEQFFEQIYKDPFRMRTYIRINRPLPDFPQFYFFGNQHSEEQRKELQDFLKTGALSEEGL